MKLQAGPVNLYAVQVGAFRRKANAQRQANFYRDEGFVAEIMPARQSNGDKIFRVLVGRYVHKRLAEATGREFAQKYRARYRIIEIAQ